MKRRLFSLLLAAILLAALALPASAADGGSCALYIKNASIPATGTGSLSVYLEAPQAQSGNFILRYDPHNVILESAVAANQELFTEVNATEPGLIRVGFMGQDCGGQLLELTFSAQPGAAFLDDVITAFDVLIYDQNARLLPCTVYSGSLSLEHVTLGMDSVQKNQDGTVQVPIRLEGVSQVLGGSFLVTYDRQILEPVSLVKGDEVSAMFTYGAGEEGCSVAFAAAAPLPVLSGPLCTLVFRVLDPSAYGTLVTINPTSMYDAEEQPLLTVGGNSYVNPSLPEPTPPVVWLSDVSTDAAGMTQATLMVQGDGLVCGGDLTLQLSAGLGARLEQFSAASGAMVSAKDDTLRVAFAWALPRAEAVPLAHLTFSQVPEGARVVFGEGSVLYDAAPAPIDGVHFLSSDLTARPHYAQILATAQKQAQVEVTFLLVTDSKAEPLDVLLALYDEKGRMVGLEQAYCGSHGACQITLTVRDTSGTAAACKLFFTAWSDPLRPVCTACSAVLT